MNLPQMISDFLLSNVPLFIVCVLSVIVLITVLCFNQMLREKCNRFKARSRKLQIRLEAEKAFAQAINERIVSIERIVNDREGQIRVIEEMAKDLNMKHQQDLEAQANIADANIQRLHKQVRDLKDGHRKRAFKEAVGNCQYNEQVVPLAKDFYNFLIGKA